MKFFYPDCLDLVDPTFNFRTETSSLERVPQRDDVYAHELYGEERPYDGILVSKFLLDGTDGKGRYTGPQRQRFMRDGAQRFLRFPTSGLRDPVTYPIIGDCGAFNYSKSENPPYSVNEVVEFYEGCGFTHGVSVDHIIQTYDVRYDQNQLEVPAELTRRSNLTLQLADEFLQQATQQRVQFIPMGVAQAWSPKSYQTAVVALLKMGYTYIALGGIVPLSTSEILEVLSAVRDVTQGRTRLHLLGITRLGNYTQFAKCGVVSLDSTSPLRRGVKEGAYYGEGGPFTTLRIPQTAVYPKLRQKIQAGEIRQETVQHMEETCLGLVQSYAQGYESVETVLAALREYERVFEGNSSWVKVEQVLRKQPWRNCPCAVCKQLGINVVVFRGANRNRRRGFHNLWYTHSQLRRLRTASA